MAENIKVVAHYNNGKIVKGSTQDFFPNRSIFHLQPAQGAAVEIRCRDLKAVFFVKDLEGNQARRDLRGFIQAPAENSHGKKLAVRFKDGELMCGYSLSYSNDRDGFFVFPADPGSNNLRVYVITASTAEVKAGPAADLMAQKHLDKHAA
jgi:hypothetical protein